MELSREELKEGLQNIALLGRTVGMSVAAVSGSSVVFSHAIGYRDLENRLPATTDTVYRLASLSKHLSALSVMTLVDRQLADLDADIGDYLGYPVRNPYFPDVPITLRQLMTHTSTFLEQGSYNSILAGEMPPYALFEILTPDGPGYRKDNYLHKRPGEAYAYSSFGTGIMGAVAERITGKKFAAFVKDAVFSPLDLPCSYDPSDIDPDKLAKPYEVGEAAKGNDDWLYKSLKNKLMLSSLPIGEAYRMAQGNAHMRVYDLAVTMNVFFSRGTAKGVRILSPKLIDEMTKPQFTDGRITTGLNLLIMDDLIEGKQLLGHYGRAYGAFTGMVFHPKEQKGAIVLTNGTEDALDSHGHNRTISEALRLIYRFVDSI